MGVPGKNGNEKEVTEMTGKEWEHQRSDGAWQGRNEQRSDRPSKGLVGVAGMCKTCRGRELKILTE